MTKVNYGLLLTQTVACYSRANIYHSCVTKTHEKLIYSSLPPESCEHTHRNSNIIDLQIQVSFTYFEIKA